ncbi:MAG: hypothetical protein N2C14_33055, partial [Planctomycetales bacterium]
MNLTMAYLGRSEFQRETGRAILNFAPNLSRDPVSFDGALQKPLRFREAISALHDVVINDLRYKPRDKTAYLQWKETERKRAAHARREALQAAKDEILAKRQDVPAGFERQFENSRR